LKSRYGKESSALKCDGKVGEFRQRLIFPGAQERERGFGIFFLGIADWECLTLRGFRGHYGEHPIENIQEKSHTNEHA
jgi:hypothetical protein